MSTSSKIEWTEASWNPTRGCTKIGPGCKHCYAETFAERWKGLAGHPYEQGFLPRLVPESLGLPLTWKRPRRIFVDSMSDLFHESFPYEYIAAVFGVMAACPQHTFQVLTKRADRLLAFFGWLDARALATKGVPEWICRAEAARALSDAVLSERLLTNWIVHGLREEAARWPLSNVWLGVSAEDQQHADERIPALLASPAAVRFVSAEPLLGEVDLWAFLKGDIRDRSLAALGEAPTPGLDWVIAGGESGPGARLTDIQWLRSLRDQCKAAGVPFFLKQLGARAYESWPDMRIGIPQKSKKGGDPAEWPEDLRNARAFPEVRS